MTDAELLERTRTAEAGTDDWNFFNDEYDRRHRQEYADLTDHHRAILDQSQPTLDDAYAMLATADQHFHYGGHARPERTELLAQRHTLQDYIDQKEADQAAAEQGTTHYSKPMEDPQKKSDAAEHVEKRLAELNRLEEKEQTSILSGNSADLNSNENYSPGIPGAQSNAPSVAKVRNKFKNAKGLQKKMPGFINKIEYGGKVTAESFAETLIEDLGGNRSIGQVSDYI